jgi:hypothetical protein
MAHKGALSNTILNRDWPYQVAVRSHQNSTTQFARYNDMRRFCREYGLGLAPRGHSVFYDDAWWNVLCFSKAEDADRFKTAFDGTSFNPRDRGAGKNWAKWEPKRSATRQRT